MSRAEYPYRPPFESYWCADLQRPMFVERVYTDEKGFVRSEYLTTRQTIVPNMPARVIREKDMPMINVSETGGGNFKSLEAGIYGGRCDLIADLGLQETRFGEKHKVYIRFGIPDQVVEKDDGEKFQMAIGQTFTASLSKRSNLRKALEAWRGKPFTAEELKGFDLTKLLGAPATLVVEEYTQDGETKSKIGNILRSKSDPGKLFREPVSYSEDSTPAELETAPNWIREKIQEQQAARKGGAEQERQHEAASRQDDEDAGFEDDIPF